MIRVLVLSSLLLASRADLQERLYEQNPFLNIDGIQPEPIKEYPKQEVQNGTLKENSTAVPERLVTIEPPEVLDPKYLLKYCLQPNGLFPSRYCNKFVNCWDGNAIEQFCPPTLVFNPRGYCDYAYHVHCYGKPIAPFPKPDGHWPSDGSYLTTTSDLYHSTSYRPTISVEIPTAAPPLSHDKVIKYCLKPRGQFPSKICSKFVNCWDGTAYEQDCPTGLLFNAEKGYCDYAGNVRCHYAAKVATPIAVVSPCLKPEGMFRNQTDCSKYFICSENEVEKRFSCPLGYHFNDKIGVCDLADRVDCANSSPSEYTWPKAIVDPHLACQPGTIFKYDECNRVAICREGVTEIIKCPTGLAYDVASNSCMDPKLAKC